MTNDITGFVHYWVVCQDCNMKRHGSNSEIIKRLHEQKYPTHKCKVVIGTAEHP